MANPLVAFALVAEEYEKSGDPIKGLSPLFLPILKRQGVGNVYDAKTFSSDFSQTYGLEMSEFVARALADRMQEINLLQPGRTTDEFLIAPLPVGEFADFDESEIVKTVNTFADWAEKEVLRFGRTVTRTTLEQAFLGRLARPEFSSAFLADAETRDNSQIRALLGKSILNGVSEADQIFDYLVARFVIAASEQAPEVFAAVSSIAFGALIADAISGLAGSGVQKMPDPPLRVAIDGPLILDILGLNDKAHQVYAEGLFEIMRKAGVRLATFDHVVDEVRDSIRSVLKAFASGTEYGPLGQRLRQEQGYSTYATTVADTIEDRIKGLDVSVLPSEVYERSDFKKYFTDDEFDRMRNAIGDLHFQFDRRTRDAKSVATVVRLKKNNRKPNSVFDAGTIFVTRNSALQRGVNKTLSIGRSEPDPRFAIATDAQIGGIFWFSLGSAVEYSRVSQQRLIANCASAMLPHREIIQRITEFLGKTDPSLLSEFTALMRDKRASLCPMRMTGGLLDRVDSESSLRVLEAMRDEIAAPVREEMAYAQIQSAEEKRILEESLQQSKAVSSELQQIIGKKERQIDEKDRVFNEQLAQLSIEIEGEKIARRGTKAAIEGAREKLISECNSIENELRRKRGTLAKIFRGCWVGACVAATAIPILGSEEQIHKLAGVVILLLASSLPVLSEKVRDGFEWLTSFFWPGQEARLNGLRSQLQQLENIHAVA